MRLIRAAGDVAELQLFAGRLSAALLSNPVAVAQLPAAFRFLEGHVRPVLAALRAKAFQQAMQLIAYL